MLKWVQCVRRRPELTVVEFRRRWVEYGEAITSLGAQIGAVRIEVSASLVVEANLEWQARRGSAAPFDGLAEIHFSGSAPEFLEALRREGPKAEVERLLRMQEEFVDVPHSCFFLASQDVEAEFSLPG